MPIGYLYCVIDKKSNSSVLVENLIDGSRAKQRMFNGLDEMNTTD